MYKNQLKKQKKKKKKKKATYNKTQPYIYIQRADQL